MSSETETASPPLNIEKCALIIVDVAGTTTSINFVKDTLFPYALKHVETFLQSKWEEESVKECIKDLKTDSEAELDIAGAVELIKSLSEKNSDNKGLKTLQGLIYQQGYESGELKAHVFDDVAEAFENWAKARNVAIYSTGSIESQRLLFKHTTAGDISGHIFKYFDQSIGSKTEAESFKKIAKEFQLEPEEVIFVTDSLEEAKAAKTAGLTAILIKREGNAAIAPEDSKDFKVISSFNELGLEKSAKRKIEESVTTDEAPPKKVAKTEEEEKKTEEVKAKAEEKPKVEETMEVDATSAEKAKENVTEPEKTIEKPVDETETMETDKAKETTVAEKSKTEDKTSSSTETSAADEEMKTVEDKQTEKKEVVSEDKVVEEEKPKEETVVANEEKTEDKVDKPIENGDVKENDVSDEKNKVEKDDEKKPEEETTDEVKPAVAATTETEPKTEEKENKSVLANGAENGSNGKVVDSENDSEQKESAATESDVKKDDVNEVKVDKTEVIVKKLEESTETSKTVSVEV